MKNKVEQSILDSMTRDPRNWKGMMYFNRKDPRLIVPKMDPVRGWTFNFASPYSYVTFGAIVVIIALVALFRR